MKKILTILLTLSFFVVILIGCEKDEKESLDTFENNITTEPDELLNEKENVSIGGVKEDKIDDKPEEKGIHITPNEQQEDPKEDGIYFTPDDWEEPKEEWADDDLSRPRWDNIKQDWAYYWRPLDWGELYNNDGEIIQVYIGGGIWQDSWRPHDYGEEWEKHWIPAFPASKRSCGYPADFNILDFYDRTNPHKLVRESVIDRSSYDNWWKCCDIKKEKAGLHHPGLVCLCGELLCSERFSIPHYASEEELDCCQLLFSEDLPLAFRIKLKYDCLHDLYNIESKSDIWEEWYKEDTGQSEIDTIGQ